MAVNYPIINGACHSFASITLDVDGEQITGFRAINYSSSLEPGEVRASGVQVLGRTRGEHTAEGSLELLLLDWKALRTKLGAGYGEKVFTVVVNYSEDGIDTITDTLVGVRIKNVSHDNGQGSDASMVTLDLSILDVLEDGLSIVKDSLYK